MSSMDTYWVCSWWTSNNTPFRGDSTKLGESNFLIWVSFFKCNVCEHLSVCLHNPFSWEAVCCIHHPHRKHEQDQLFFGPLLYLFFWKGYATIPFLCFSSLADWIKYSEIPGYSEQYFCDQESGIKVHICNFSVFEAVTNFSFIVACRQAPQLYSW